MITKFVLVLVATSFSSGLGAKVASNSTNVSQHAPGGLRRRQSEPDASSRHSKPAAKEEEPKAAVDDAVSMDSLAASITDAERRHVLREASKPAVPPPAKSQVTLPSSHEQLARAAPVPPAAPAPPPANAKATGELDASGEPRLIFGARKIFWALLADAVAMAIFVSCVPFILTLVKRRRPQPQTA